VSALGKLSTSEKIVGPKAYAATQTNFGDANNT
jgi:hypothetical protein